MGRRPIRIGMAGMGQGAEHGPQAEAHQQGAAQAADFVTVPLETTINAPADAAWKKISGYCDIGAVEGEAPADTTAPVATAPVETFYQRRGAVSETSIKVGLIWSATDEGYGVARYELERGQRRCLAASHPRGQHAGDPRDDALLQQEPPVPRARHRQCR